MKRFFFSAALAIILVSCVCLAGCTLGQTGTQATETSTIQFSSSPSGAEVYLDNQYRGNTPATIADVSYGSHTLEYRMSGYRDWLADVTVASGTSSYFATLTPSSITASATTSGTDITGQVTPASTAIPTKISVMVSKDVMVIGDSQTFSGSCIGSTSVLLVLYGPGKYTDGVQIGQTSIASDNSWRYTWNPGTAVLQGSYTIVAYDGFKTASAKAGFTVIGGGKVTITTSSVMVSQGATVTYTGMCTSGSQRVVLTLYGPGQFANGVSVATLLLNADKTYSYRYTYDLSKPLGTYTMYVRDEYTTGSSSVSISLNSA
ncbi:MAG: PEGA domain-containing protein [Methanoregula sp.]|jgi:hypothetical protein